MRNRGNVDRHRFGLTLALIGLTGWIVPADWAFNWTASSSSALTDSSSMRPAYSRSANDSVPTAFDSTPPVNVWTSNGPEGVEILSLAIDPVNPSVIYAGTKQGVFKSTNGGGGWSASNDGLPDSTARALAVDPIDPNTIYAAIPGRSDNSGLFKSTNGGVNWSRTSARGGSIDTVAIAFSNPNIIYVGSSYPDDYRTDLTVSTDGGETWEVRKGPDGIWGTSVWSLAVDPQDSNILYIYIEGDTSNGPCKSTDGGRSWTVLFLVECRCVYYVGWFVIDPNNSNIVYLVTDGGVYKSLDGGAGWTNLGLEGSSALAVASSNSNILYALSGRGVFKSTDGGSSWGAFNDGLTNLPNALAVDASGTHLHAGTEAGVFGYHYGDACAVSFAPVTKDFEANGGTGTVDVSARDECSWAATSGASWISITSGRSATSGNGTVDYSVDPNTSTLLRTGTVVIAARAITITQAGLPVRITSASVTGKNLVVNGENFDTGAVILLNGEEQKTKHNKQPGGTLTGKKTGKKIKPGDKLQVRNPNGTMSEEFTFTG